MYLTDTEYTFVFNDVLKHFRPSFKEKPLVFRAFPQNPKLCPISTLIQYLGMRLSRSSNTVLFFTIDSPYKAASSETMGRWIKNTMQEAGINTFFFSTCSCREAATSKAHASDARITAILQQNKIISRLLYSFYLQNILFKGHSASMPKPK